MTGLSLVVTAHLVGRGALSAAIGLALAALPIAVMAQPRTVAEIANYTGGDRQKVLEQGARKEAALLIYSTGTQIQPVIDRFKRKYQFLRVELARAPSSDVAGKVLEEYSAGVYLAGRLRARRPWAPGSTRPRHPGAVHCSRSRAL